MLTTWARTLIQRVTTSQSQGRHRSPSHKPVRLRPVLEGFEPRIVPDSYTFDGECGSDYRMACSWSPDRVPAAGDDAVIGGLFSVTLNGSGSRQLANLRITDEARLTIDGPLLDMTGDFTVGAEAELRINSGQLRTFSQGRSHVLGKLELRGELYMHGANGVLELDGQTIFRDGGMYTTNQGTRIVQDGIFQWNGGAFGHFVGATGVINNGFITAAVSANRSGVGVMTNNGSIFHTGDGTLSGTLTNNGTYVMQSDAGFETGSLLNRGVVRKAGGSGLTTLFGLNNEGGQLDIQTGSVRPVQTRFTGTSRINVANGTTLELASPSGSNTIGGTLTMLGQGRVLLAGTLLNVLAGGTTIDAPPGMLVWTSGTIGAAPHDLTVTNLTVDNPAEVTMNGTLNNAGTIVLRGPGGVRLGGSTDRVVNRFGSTLELRSDARWRGTGRLVNAGTLHKVAGAGTSLFETHVDLTGGAIDVSTGTIRLADDGIHTSGAFAVAAGSAVVMTSATMTGQFFGSGEGVVSLAGILTTGAAGASLSFPAGMFRLLSGEIRGGATGLTNAGFLTLTGTTTKTLSGLLINTGTLTYASTGNFDLSSGSEFRNQGTYRLEADAHLNGGGKVVNRALFWKENAGTSQINVTFDNLGGVLQASAGADLLLGDGLHRDSGFAVSAGAAVTFSLSTHRELTFAGNVAGIGKGSVSLQRRLTVDANGSTLRFEPGVFSWVSGIISGGRLTNALEMSVRGAFSRKDLNVTAFDNPGTIRHRDGDLHILGGPVNNTGTYNFTGEFTGNAAIESDLATPFLNPGLLLKSRAVVEGTTALNFPFLSTGTVRIQDGALQIARDFTNSGDVVLEAETAALALDRGYVQTAGGTFLAGGYLSVRNLLDIQGGRLLGFGVIAGNVRNAGRVEVGAVGAAGFLIVVGNYTQTAVGSLETDVFGNGSSDILLVTELATLGGSLDVRLRNGYVPAAGDIVLPLICVQRADMFATITGLSISPTRAWLPQYFENGLLLFAYDM